MTVQTTPETTPGMTRPTTAPGGPGPRSVLDLSEAVGRHGECADALAGLLLECPALVNELTDPASLVRCLRERLNADLEVLDVASVATRLRALKAVMALDGSLSEAADLYRGALDRLTHGRAEPGADPQTVALARELVALYHGTGREREAEAVAQRMRVSPGPGRPGTEASFYGLRGAALEAYQAGQFAEAEVIYRRLVRLPDEPANIHCHLARVLIARGRYAEAALEVQRGWERRETVASYILARLLYLRALLQTLEGQDARQTLNEIRRMARDSAVSFEWALDPMLEQVRPRLTPESYDFFTRLGRQLSDGTPGPP